MTITVQSAVASSGNLTGPITSVGLATSIASQTGTGTKFVVDTGPSISSLTATGTTTPTGLVDISGASAGQIKFPASQNASANVNTLDDYEEGTWTPTMTFNGSSTGVTYSVQSGAYRKIGSIVFITGRITLSNNGSGVGAALITGLPFTTATDANFVLGGVSIVFWNAMSGIVGTPTGLFGTAATSISLYMSGAGTAAAMTDTNVPNTGDIIFNGWYLAAN